MRKVIAAELHDHTWVPGVGPLKKTLDPNMYKGIEMKFDNAGIYVQFKDKHFFLPISNFKSVVFDGNQE